VNGVYAKFILMEPGTIVKLRSCISKDVYNKGNIRKYEETTVWYVENWDDFAPLKFDVKLNLQYGMDTNGNIVDLNETEYTWSHTYEGSGNNYGGAVVGFATKRVKEKSNGNITFSVDYSETQPKELEDGLSFITDITV
jgi:hypothetical protein